MPLTTQTKANSSLNFIAFPPKFCWLVLLLAVFLTSLFVANPAPAQAAGGDRDTTFSATAATNNVYATALQPDGKIIIAGDFVTVTGVTRNRIARLNKDGSLDTSFDPNADNIIYAVVLQPDGKIIVGGSFTNVAGTARNRLARLNNDGTIDTSFNPNSNNTIRAIVLQPDGKIVVGGAFTSIAGTAINRIARLNSGGTYDSTFTPGSNTGTGTNGISSSSTVFALTLDSNGNVIAGGDFTAIRGTSWNRLARFSGTNGALDTTFGVTGATNGITSGGVRALAIQSNGKIIVGGTFSQYNGIVTNNRIIRVNATDGLQDTTFTANATNDVYALTVLPNDEVYAGGAFTTFNAVTFNRVVRLQADGTTNAAFVTNGTGRGATANVYAFSLQPDGRLIIGGAFVLFNNSSANSRIVRVEGLTGNLQFSASTYTAPEGTNAIITATRTAGSDGLINAGILITDVTTTASDYSAPATSTVTFAWTWLDTASKTFTIPITLDATPEITETFNLGFQIFDGAPTVTNPMTATVIIPAQLVTTTMSLTSTPNPSGFGQAATFTATVTGCCSYPIVNSGAVTFTEGAAILAANVPVNANGVATFVTNTLSVGAHNITATYNGGAAAFGTSSATIQHFVVGALLQNISLTPITATIPAGATQKFYATGSFSDGSTQDITASALWSTSQPSVASQNGSLATGLTAGTTTVSAAYTATNGSLVTGTATLTVTSKIVIGLTITSTRAVIGKGETEQFYAVANYSDGSTADVSTSATWSSSVVTVASVISNSGLATGLNAGSTVISATFSGFSATKPLYVTEPKLTGLYITPTNPSIPKGTTQQFQAFGTYTDGIDRNLTTVVTWTTSNVATATISTSGLATGVAPGTVIVTATNSTFLVTTTLQVRNADLIGLQISPATATTPQGATIQFNVVGKYSDNTNGSVAVSWSTSDGTIATINGLSGLATGVAPGTAIIYATNGVFTGTATLNVTSATPTGISVTPITTTLAAGLTAQYSAVVTYSDSTTRTMTSAVTWSTANTTIATIASNGLLTAQNTGTTTVKATLGSLTSSNVTVTVTAAIVAQIIITPTDALIGKGATQSFSIIGINSKGQNTAVSNTSVNWGVVNGTIASISTSGVATGLAVGTTVVTASLKTNLAVTSSANLTVGPPVVTQITLAPLTATVALGNSQQFTATAKYSDNSTQNVTTLAQWSTANNITATVNSTGLATGVGSGSTLVQAFYQGITGTATITVGAAILSSVSVTPNNVVLGRGQSQPLNLIGNYSDGTTNTLTTGITWTTSASSVVTVSSSGVITGVNLGSAVVTGTYSGLRSTANVSVIGAQLQSIAISPSVATVGQGASLQYLAIGTYTDGTTQNITSLVSWFSSNLGTATINAAGAATGVAPGATTITATYQGKTSNPATLNVSSATVVSLAVSPANRVIPNGTTLNYQAIATLSNGVTQTLATGLTWSSSLPAVATIIGTGTSIATGQSLGTTTIKAVYDANPAISATTSLAVSDAVVQSLTITPTAVTAVTGQKVAFTALGNFSDGQSRDVTGLVIWSSLNPSVASVSNLPGAFGETTALSVGTATLQATYGAITATATLTVNVAATNITLTANPPFGANFGQTVTFSATVQAVAPGTGFPTPGLVQFYDGATPLGGPVAVDGSGVATFNTATLASGTHTIRAQFTSQTANYADSGFATLAYFIGKDSTTTTLTVTPEPSDYGQVVTLTAQVTAPSGAVSGVVSFTYGSGTFIGTANLAGGTASLLLPNLPAGVVSFTATYLGNASFNPSATDIVFHVVNKISSQTTLAVTPSSPATFNQSLTFTATVTSTVGTPDGLVNFFDGPNLLFSATLNGNGQAVYVTNTLPTGNYNLVAQYLGGSNHLPSASGGLAYTILAATAGQILVAQYPSPVLAGTTDFFRVTVKDQFGNLATGYTGTVSFSSDDPQASLPSAYTFTAQDNGTKLFTATLRTAGSRTITATDGGLAGAQLGIVVNAANPVVISATNGSGQVQNSGQFFTSTLQATLYDSFNNPVAGRVVTFTAPISTTGALTGVFEDGSSQYVTTTNAAGVATSLGVLAGLNSGSYLVIATTSGLGRGANFTLTNNGGNCTPTLVTFSQDDGNATTCGTLSYALSVAFNADKPVTVTIAPSVGVLELSVPLTVPAGGVIIDGGCQNGVPQTTLRAKAGLTLPTGLTLNGGGAVRGLILTGFSSFALELKGSTNRVLCSYIGNVDSNGLANGGGIRINANSSNNSLGEPNNPASGNFIAGNNGVGLQVEANSKNNLLYYNSLGYGSDGAPRINSGGSLKLAATAQVKFRFGNRLA